MERPEIQLAGPSAQNLAGTLPIIGDSGAFAPGDMFPQADTKNSAAVSAVARATFLHHHPGADTSVVDRLFRDVEDMFAGRYLDYLPLEMRYHDLEHTVQAVLGLVQLREGR